MQNWQVGLVGNDCVLGFKRGWSLEEADRKANGVTHSLMCYFSFSLFLFLFSNFFFGGYSDYGVE